MEDKKNIELRKAIEETKKQCEELKSLINDEKYKGYKEALELRLNLRINQRNNLIKNVKSNDEYLRLSILFDAEINLLNEIINIPEKFFERLRELENKGEKENG